MIKHIKLLFFCCSILTYSQEKLKVNYEVISNHTKVNFGNDFNLSEELKQQMLEKIEKQSKEQKKYTLYYYDGNSYFTKDNSSTSGKQKQEYFKIKNRAGFYILSDFIVEEFYGYYPDNNFEIEYKNETQTIENYICKLAVVRISNEINKVWYTEEIPVSIGPFIYNNFPGLVLKVERPNYLCYATHISKDTVENNIKKMNPDLKIYQGEELEVKNKEGLEKRMNHSKEVFEMNKKKTTKL